MYQYQNNILSVPAKLIYEDLELIAYNTYKSWCQRGHLVRTKEGKGLDNEAWISYYDISKTWVQNAIKAYLGDPKKVVVQNILEDYIKPDPAAAKFFSAHRTPIGKPLSFDKQRNRATNCMILNAISTVINEKGIANKVFGKKRTKIWKNISDAVNALNSDKWNYTLPGNERSLKRKYDRYIKESYWAFIHKNEGTKNARKVTADIEMLLISLYCLPNKPYIVSVSDLYLDFLAGEIEVIDIKTGEVYDRTDFYDNGQPITVSEKTVWNYIKKPKNQLIIKKYRDGAYDFSHKERPHVNRTAPNFSMSKISLDDRDIMHTKMHDGNKVMAYYAFDDMSTAMIGISHSKQKDHVLFLDCIRNMFRFTTNKGLGVPMQMEVEHHLVKDFKDGLMKAGNMFPFVRWCNPTNSQEKYAENRIRSKKYGVEKNNNQNVGRHYSRMDSNRITRQKIFDEQNDNYKFAKADYKAIVAQELQEQIEYNNQPHPDQTKFKGMSRLQVFLDNVNPNLPQLDRAQLAKYIGIHVSTSVRRNQYVTVQYGKYQLESPQVIEQLAPNNYKVDAYYLPSELNEVNEVFIYQNDSYICTCQPAPTFNRANAEWTDEDMLGYKNATKYISRFDKMVKEDTNAMLNKVTILKNPKEVFSEAEIISEAETEEIFEYEAVDTAKRRNRAINDL